MRPAPAKADSSDNLRAGRSSDAVNAFADPTPGRLPNGARAPASLPMGQRSPCACGGGCPRCGGGNRQGEGTTAPVPAALRSRAEATLGVGLSDVRLAESGPLAAHVASRGADAGTRGNVIAFPRGVPDLSRAGGRFAVSHELAHVAQQRTGPVPDSANLSSAQERGADLSAQAISGVDAGQAGRRGEVQAETLNGSPVQFGAFDVIGSVGRAVNDFVAPVVDPVGQVFHETMAEGMMGMLDIPALAGTFLMSLPQRALRLLYDAFQGGAGVGEWIVDLAGLFWHWQGWDAIWNHMVEGVLGAAAWVGEFLMHALEVVGVGEFLQFIWARANVMAPLNSEQIGAAQEVHPPGLIPYSMIRVDYNSLVARLAALPSATSASDVAAQIFGTDGADHRAVTTMHVIHTGHTMGAPLAVHELTHVAQYELVGAMYMPQAIHAQQFGQGYDYKLLHGSLTASIAAGATYADFNREQQAMICQDYYQLRHGMGAEKGGTGPELEHFVNDYWGRAGIPFVRWFVDQ